MDSEELEFEEWPGHEMEIPELEAGRHVTSMKHVHKEKKIYHEEGYGWWWLGTIIMWLIVLIVLFWIIYYSLKPGFVMNSGTNEVNVAKVLLAAVVTALIIVIIFALIRLTIRKK